MFRSGRRCRQRPLTLRRADSDEPASTARAYAASRLHSGAGKSLGQRLELGVRLRAIGERGPVCELLEREPPLGGRVTQPDDDMLALSVRRALLEFAAHSNDSL